MTTLEPSYGDHLYFVMFYDTALNYFAVFWQNEMKWWRDVPFYEIRALSLLNYDEIEKIQNLNFLCDEMIMTSLEPFSF
jgi:hypothetical protein